MWKISQYTKQDIPEMVSMAHEFYGDTSITDESYLNWQYEENCAGKAFLALAKKKDTDELIGKYVVIPQCIKVNQTIVSATLSLNTLTKKEYWGKGIFTGLANDVFEALRNNGVEFTYGFPNPNSYPGFINKLGFLEIGRVPLLLKPLDIRSLINAKISPKMGWVSQFFNFFFKVKSIKDEEKERIFEIGQDHLALFDDLWTEVNHKYKVIGVRNSRYIQWRYFNIPLREYKIFGAKDSNGNLLGYIIGRCTMVANMKCGMVVDFLIKPQEVEEGKLLVKAILQYFLEQGMALAGSLMLKHTEEYTLLKKNGFIKCPKFLEIQPFPVILREHRSPTDSTLNNLDNWFLTMGDYDVI